MRKTKKNLNLTPAQLQNLIKGVRKHRQRNGKTIQQHSQNDRSKARRT